MTDARAAFGEQGLTQRGRPVARNEDDMTIATHVPSDQLLAERFSRAIVTRDWSALATIVTPDATWTFPGDNIPTGTVTAPAQLAEKARPIGS